MTTHAAPVAMVEFSTRDITLSNGGSFVLGLSPGIADADVRLVIDIYDLDDPVHPSGHVGWWAFHVEGLGTEISGTLARDGGSLVPTLAGIDPSGAWVNETPPDSERFLVAAVLRARATNAIVDIDRVPAMTDAEAVADLRADSRLVLPAGGLALPDFTMAPGSTVRIVADSIAARDAVGNLCIDLHRMLRAGGVRTALYATHMDIRFNDTVRRKALLATDMQQADQLFYMHSTFDPALPGILELACARRIAYFHGVTEPTLSRVFDPELAVACERAIGQIPLLQGFDVLATNSRASARFMLDRFGPDTAWRDDQVQVIAPKLIASDPIGSAAPGRRNGGARFLFVGRIAPHKKVDDVLTLFARYLERDPDAECWIVGGGAVKAYRDYLNWMEETELALPKGKVRWFGSVDEVRLDGLYDAADALVCMSEHEGFCLPVLEAMCRGLPVFAYGIDAVREVLGGAGLCFDDKDFDALAERLHGALADEAALAGLIEGGRQRARALVADMDGSAFWRLLAPA